MAVVHPAPETLHPAHSHQIDSHQIGSHQIGSHQIGSHQIGSHQIGSRPIDIHQHLWPGELVEALRARREAPRLDGWTLVLGGEPPYDVHRADHDPDRRRAQDSGRIVLGLSSPLGIEDLPVAQGAPLLEAWHQGVAGLGGHFEAWASVSHADPDLDGLRGRLAAGFVGLQISAGELATPGRLERTAAILRVCEAAGKPVFVHPGPVAGRAGHDAGTEAELLPSWWAAVVDYPSQLQAAWWSWQAVGRQLLPDLRICFAAGAGLGPVHHERFLARGGRPLVSDPGVFVDTSSYSRQGLDSLIRVLGIDPIVIGSDRPYGEPTEPDLGEAAAIALCHTNPLRLLEGTRS
jgi:hypothetical protein